MNNKGFTLIELIATIGLLAVVSIISYVSINKVIEESKVNDCEQLVMSIKSASNEYASDNRYSLTTTANLNINGSTLVNNKYLSSPIINPFDKSEINPGNIDIEIKLKDDYTVETVVIKAPSFLKECKSE